MGTAGIVRPPDLSSHSWAPTWPWKLGSVSQVLAKNSARHRGLPGPRPRRGIRACVRGFALQGLSRRDGSECCWAGPTAFCTRPGPILLFKAVFQSKSLKSPEWVQRAPLCAGDRAQVLRPRLAVLARSLFLARPQDSAGTWVSVSWLEKALSKRKVLYLGGGVPGT